MPVCFQDMGMRKEGPHVHFFVVMSQTFTCYNVTNVLWPVVGPMAQVDKVNKNNERAVQMLAYCSCIALV